MSAREDERRRRARTRLIRESIDGAFRRLREDAALTQAAVARSVGISPGHLCGIEKGSSEASTAVLVGIADVLGADLSVRAYPNTGPRIHDKIQSLIVEHLLRTVDLAGGRSSKSRARAPRAGTSMSSSRTSPIRSTRQRR